MASRNQRLANIGYWALPPSWSPDYQAARDFLKARETPAIRKAVRNAYKKAAASVNCMARNGAGFPMDDLLRYYMREYNHRAFNHGLHSMPASFAFIEAFVEYQPQTNYFRLRQERDHLVSLPHYFDWFTSDQCSYRLEDVLPALEDGLIYSFNSTDVPVAIEFSLERDDQFCVAGVSLVRFRNEVVVMLLAGVATEFQAPLFSMDTMAAFPGKEEITPSPELTHRRVALEGTDDRQRTIVLTRLDLSNRIQPFRYLAYDVGDMFHSFTDDTETLRKPNGEIDDQSLEVFHHCAERLNRNSALFAMCKTMLFLPEYCAQHAELVNLRREDTKLKQAVRKLSVRKQVEFADEEVRHLQREVRVVTPPSSSTNRTVSIVPPKFQRPSDGYWKTLLPWELGVDREGKPSKGRTWIAITTSGTAEAIKEAQLVQVERTNTSVDRSSPNHGFIYVLRNPQNERHIYKIGLTRRTSVERAEELSRATGVLDYFAVMEEWEVADCVEAERMVHDQLADARISERREFFRCDYRRIFRTVDEVVATINGHSKSELGEGR